MNIFDQAMELEKAGIALYQEFSSKASDAGMKKVFNWLAEQETRHYQIFQELKASGSVTVAESPVIEDIKSILDGWENGSNCIQATAAQAEIYRKALDIENKSISIYEKYANTASAPQKEVFLKIAAEEQNHKMMVETIIKLAAKFRPQAESK